MGSVDKSVVLNGQSQPGKRSCGLTEVPKARREIALNCTFCFHRILLLKKKRENEVDGQSLCACVRACVCVCVWVGWRGWLVCV